MAPFENVRARKIDDEEESFLDWEGEATLFAEDDEEEEEESASAEAEAEAKVDDEDEDEDFADDDDDVVEELDFG